MGGSSSPSEEEVPEWAAALGPRLFESPSLSPDALPSSPTAHKASPVAEAHAPTTYLTLTLEGNYADFPPPRRQAVLDAVVQHLDIPPEMARLGMCWPGSIKLEVLTTATPKAQPKLVFASRSLVGKDLGGHKCVHATLGACSTAPCPPASPPPPSPPLDDGGLDKEIDHLLANFGEPPPSSCALTHPDGSPPPTPRGAPPRGRQGSPGAPMGRVGISCLAHKESPAEELNYVQ